jgi:hypothetical protein
MRKILSSLLILLLCCFVVMPSSAQEAQISLHLGRDFGYSSGTGRIQGLFTLSASGPASLARVVFLMDGQSMGEDSEAPFKVQFDTSQYALGEHVISARGYTSDGAVIAANEIRATFTPADEGMKAAGAIALPVFGLILGVMLLSFVITMASARKKGSLPLGTPRNYGLWGGTICTKCGRPFAFHASRLKLLVGSLDFCPHCGKWSFLRPVPLAALRAAEAAELEWDKPAAEVQGISEEEKLRKEMDDSRYQGA